MEGGLLGHVRVCARSGYANTERHLTRPFPVSRMVWVGSFRNIRPFIRWRERCCRTFYCCLVCWRGKGEARNQQARYKTWVHLPYILDDLQEEWHESGRLASKCPVSALVAAAGPVSRILSAGLLPQDGHSSGPRITARLKRPTRRL